MKKLLIIGACLILAVAFYLSHTTINSKAPTAIAAAKYVGTLYVAGMGGHFAAADVEIDPSAAKPIKVTKLDRVVIGTKATHPTHDARIDVNDSTKMYWSTYIPDKNIEGGRTLHVGISDLKTGNVIKDVPIKIADRATWIGANYCASGQSSTMFIPVMMTDEAYIDVLDKKTLELKHRVFLPYKKGETKFYHGINSPDMKEFMVAVNLADEGKPNGKIDIIRLDMAALEKGEAKILKQKQVTGTPGKTLTFRQTYTPDGNYILQSGADRFFLIDAKSLKLIDEEMLNEGQNHDAMATPDSKYVVLTLREMVESSEGAEGKDITDGTLLLYDIEAKGVVGTSSSACYQCHRALGIHGNSVLCGLDGNWKK
ncbi:MAG: hypothetical protein HY805_06570 [Nitrospirae bacterium]|nr:hypothetical protein [Nitrospirota bacterium]